MYVVPDARGTGVTGVLLLYALMLGHIVLLFPAEVTNLVAGFTYGIPIAMVICVSGWFASAMGTYALGRIAGRPLVAVDSVGAGVGEEVFFVRGKEASFPFYPAEPPVDAGIVGIVDHWDLG